MHFYVTSYLKGAIIIVKALLLGGMKNGKFGCFKGFI